MQCFLAPANCLAKVVLPHCRGPSKATTGAGAGNRRKGNWRRLPPADTVDPKLLEFLVCPLTKGRLEYDSARQELISRSAKLAYPIRDGIPIMLPEEARQIDAD